MRNAIIIVLMYSFCFLVFFCISRYEPLGACIWRDHLKEGFLRLRVFFMGGGGGLEGLILRNFTVLLYRLMLFVSFS